MLLPFAIANGGALLLVVRSAGRSAEEDLGSKLLAHIRRSINENIGFYGMNAHSHGDCRDIGAGRGYYHKIY